VIEHVENPFRVFAALYQIMKPNSLLIIETVFCFPYHPSPRDYWRYSPDALLYLSQNSGFKVLDCNWRMVITADKGILNIQNGEPQEIRSVYATLTKGDFSPVQTKTHTLPQRISRHPQANQYIAAHKPSI